jgi:acetoin:2,6-dichlorophenolindophenol oxidoreductase subunit alpha
MRERSQEWPELYKLMLTIRRFEEQTARMYAEGEIPGFVHLYAGEEAVAVGVCARLARDDFITSTHRGHGHLIAKGGDLRRMMAELCAKETGYCRGKGGSMHIADVGLGILGANGIVGGGLGIAVGAGYSARLRGTRQVTAAFFGDGATNEGIFHEAMNMAAAWSLPVIFVCENNQFGVSTRIDRITHESDLSKRAIGYGMSSVVVDGNDVLAVAEATETAVTRARDGEGPTFLVAKTFRQRGHFEGEVTSYFAKDELSQWKARDPILRFEQRLRDEKIAGTGELESWKKEIQLRITDAVEFARSSSSPAPHEALEGLFGGAEA